MHILNRLSGSNLRAPLLTFRDVHGVIEMSNPIYRVLFITIAAALALPATTFAKPNINFSDTLPVTGGISMAVTSHKLFEIARADNDPYTMITAAKLRRKAGLREVPLPSEEEGGAAHTSDGSALVMSWEEMLGLAVKMSNGNETVASLAEDVRAARSKGVVNGAVYSKARIKPRGKRHYRNLSFEGGKFAEVYAEGHNEANLDMYIYDADGHLICSRTDPSNVSQCGWTPAFTGNFTIVVENKSDQSSSFALMTN
ncbi:hypothetical protein R2A130_3061 [Ahrensia sp. R2A130]|nr:hypothetical protein R2A130_3061 [Ahrensia sp. R2A130]